MWADPVACDPLEFQDSAVIVSADEAWPTHRVSASSGLRLQLSVNTYTNPDAAMEELAARLAIVETESIALSAGRVLSMPIHADRDSPAADVSAMDGYAVRMSDLTRRDRIAVAGEIQPGQPPQDQPENAVLRIFTGAVVPRGAEAVVKREDTDEQPTSVHWSDTARSLSTGANIRRRGENGRAGEVVLPAGSELTAASIAAAVSFGAATVSAHRKVRCSVVVTGNELLAAEDSPKPWQLRDSNGPTVAAMIEGKTWLQLRQQGRCGDDRLRLRNLLAESLEQNDAMIFTGGVSQGDYDYVPDIIADCGGEIVFHRLPIRPGQPVLGAVTRRGQLILGLPGNPVSTACTMLRLGVPLLRRISGNRCWRTRPAAVAIENPGDKTLPLYWMRLVRLNDSITGDRSGASECVSGRARLVESQGSGDLVALGASDGFIEQPPGTSGSGPWPFYRW